jgi:integrase
VGKLVATKAYVETVRSKGREYLYYRRDGKRIRLPDYGASDFHAKYNKIHARFENKPEPVDPTSFAALINAYKASGDFTEKAPRTRKDYGHILDALKDTFGEFRPAQITRASVMAYKDSLATKPRTANYHLAILRLVLNFGVDRGWLSANPALRPKMLRGSEGPRKPWPQTAIDRFREANAGNAEMLLALDLGLYTGQRLGDVIKMRRDDYDGRLIRVVQNKTREEVWIPVHPTLKAHLDSLSPRMMLLLTKTGRAFKETHLGHRFRAAVLKADLDGLSFHGLRATAATCLAEAGCSDSEIASITGHRTQAQVAHYRRGAQKKKLAVVAMGAWVQNQTDLPNRSGTGSEQCQTDDPKRGPK